MEAVVDAGIQPGASVLLVDVFGSINRSGFEKVTGR